MEPDWLLKFVGELTPETRFCGRYRSVSVSEFTPFLGSTAPVNVMVSPEPEKVIEILAAFGLKNDVLGSVKSGVTAPGIAAKPAVAGSKWFPAVSPEGSVGKLNVLIAPSLLVESVNPVMKFSLLKPSNISMNWTLPSAFEKASLICQR